MSEPFISQIQTFGFNYAPPGWAMCHGQLLEITKYQALFSLIGTTYGGDGRTTFGLPDLRGRLALHQGNGPGLTPRIIGQKGGAESITLTKETIPPHTHSMHARGEPATSRKPSGNLLGGPPQGPIYRAGNTDATLSSESIGQTGGSQAFTNMKPFLGITWCICLQGEYPSRN